MVSNNCFISLILNYIHVPGLIICTFQINVFLLCCLMVHIFSGGIGKFLCGSKSFAIESLGTNALTYIFPPEVDTEQQCVINTYWSMLRMVLGLIISLIIGL